MAILLALVKRFPVWTAIGVFAVVGYLFRDVLTGSVNDLRVGDCFDLPGDLVEGTVIKEVQHHPCGDRHTAELILITEMSGSSSDFPTVGAMDDVAVPRCEQAFREYTGREFDTDKTYDMTYLRPTRESWGKGDRKIKCLVVRIDGQPLKGSVRTGTDVSAVVLATPGTRTLTPPATARQAPTPAPTRAVALRPEQMIIPAAEFPFAGYNVSTDEAIGGYAWLRGFDSQSKAATGYYFFELIVSVAPADTSGASLVAAQGCQYEDPGGRAVQRTEITAEVLGDGAKACRYDIGAGVLIYEYHTAERNALVVVRSNPWAPKGDSVAMADLVRVARTQIAIIQRVAPR